MSDGGPGAGVLLHTAVTEYQSPLNKSLSILKTGILKRYALVTRIFSVPVCTFGAFLGLWYLFRLHTMRIEWRLSQFGFRRDGFHLKVVFIWSAVNWRLHLNIKNQQNGSLVITNSSVSLHQVWLGGCYMLFWWYRRDGKLERRPSYIQ